MKCPPDHQRCCGEDPGASGRNFTEKLSRSTKTARKTKAAHSRRRPVFAKKSPARLQETVQHLSLSSALDHVIALAKSLSPTHGHFVGVSRKRPASALTQTEGAAEVSPPFVKRTMNVGGSDGDRAQGIVVRESFECVCGLAHEGGLELCCFC